MTTNIDVTTDRRQRGADTELRPRAKAVVPGGMYGHQNARAARRLPAVLSRAARARACGTSTATSTSTSCAAAGPIVLGHAHPEVERGRRAPARPRATAMTGPAGCMVELAERWSSTVAHADWAMFAKNGTDATTMCADDRPRRDRPAQGARAPRAPITAPRRGARRARPASPPRTAPISCTSTYNDIASVEQAAAEAGGRPRRASSSSPFRHDAGHDQELVDPAFARAPARALRPAPARR